MTRYTRSLGEYSDAEIRIELQRRIKLEEEREKKERLKKAEEYFSKIEYMLIIADKHDRTSCNDSKLINLDHGCARCFLLDAKQCGVWDESYTPKLTITPEIVIDLD